MPNTTELKNSMTGMSDRVLQDVDAALERLGELEQHGESAVRDGALRAKELVTNVRSHIQALVQTAMVAADSQPARTTSAPAPGGRAEPRAPAFVTGGEPTRMAGVPATPPGGPQGVAGPAVTHDDVGHLDPDTREAHAAPAATGEPSHDVGDTGREGSLSDAALGDGVESHETGAGTKTGRESTVDRR